MAYPSMEQYQIALQHPDTAFIDTELKAGKVRTSNIGWPLVASGGFALTYALETNGKKYAVRCFHREAPSIERRYAAISKRLAGLASNHFVSFEYQRAGIRINNAGYPLVKMAWAEGVTLGEFVEANHDDKGVLTNLIAALSSLAGYLEAQGIAHGDIQEGNLMVSNGGRKVQLIDYDGMFVPEIAALGGTELGHRDFQHPKRTTANFGSSLDRFSFIVLNITLRALCLKPSIWTTSQSGAGVIVCRANDFASPGNSKILREISEIPGMEQATKSFIAICASEFSAIPSLAEFVSGKNIPRIDVLSIANSAAAQQGGYLSQYPVLDATDYALFMQNIGSMVELVGKIVEVKHNACYGRPYIFINFAHWKGKAVKIALWSNALRGATDIPTDAWVGRWVSIRGLVEPVYFGKRHSYEHITIEAKAVTQITTLTEQEAKYRLMPVTAPPLALVRPKPLSNSDALQALMGNASQDSSRARARPPSQGPAVKSVAAKPLSANQLALERMRQQASKPQAPVLQTNQVPTTVRTGPSPAVQTSAKNAASSSAQVRHEAMKKGAEKGLFAWLKNLFS